jgi:hypothetical protein
MTERVDKTADLAFDQSAPFGNQTDLLVLAERVDGNVTERIVRLIRLSDLVSQPRQKTPTGHELCCEEPVGVIVERCLPRPKLLELVLETLHVIFRSLSVSKLPSLQAAVEMKFICF